MGHEVSIETVTAQPMLAVGARARRPELPAAIRGGLDTVWKTLGAGDFGPLGSSLVYYRPMAAGEPMDLLIGVYMPRAMEPAGELAPAETPAGEVAHVVHMGDYSGLHGAHQALHEEVARLGRRLNGHSWEVYGDWSDDPAQLRTDIYYGLRTD